MKRKIMLIDPYFKEGLKGFPLGLAYVAGALRENYEVSVLDLTARATIERRNPGEILKEELERLNPNMVGITSTSPTHKNALDVAKIVKEYRDVPIIKGGTHESNANGTTIRNNPEIDYSVVGEGEETIIELADRISIGKSVRGLEGVIFRENNEVVNNGRRALIPNLDKLPRPARDLFYLDERFDEYYSAKLFGGKKSTSIMTSRGCPYSCSFCSSKVNWGKVRQRSVENVVGELRELYSQEFRGFMFEDDMSLANKKWFLRFAEQIKGLGIEYSLQTRVDVFENEDAGEIAKALSDSGCKFMYFGIESGVQEILDKCRKGITLEQAEKAFSIARKYRIRSMASIQFGLPGEDLENLTTVRETIRTLNERLRPDEVAVSYTCLYPGSPLSTEYFPNKEELIKWYEHQESQKMDLMMYKNTAHGTHSKHLPELTQKKYEAIESLLKSDLKINRFDVNQLYET